MEDMDIISMWKAQNEKIEQSLAINNQLLREIIGGKAKSALSQLKLLKIILLFFGILYLMFLGGLIYFALVHYSQAWNYFIISVGAIFVINVIAVMTYINHLVCLSQINYDGNISQIQQDLSGLQSSIIRHTRIMYLQTPFFSTFYLSSNWFPTTAGWPFILFQIVFTFASVYSSIWIYRHMTIDNIDHKMVKSLLSGSGRETVRKAMDFYKEIEAFKVEA